MFYAALTHWAFQEPGALTVEGSEAMTSSGSQTGLSCGATA